MIHLLAQPMVIGKILICSLNCKAGFIKPLTHKSRILSTKLTYYKMWNIADVIPYKLKYIKCADYLDGSVLNELSTADYVGISVYDNNIYFADYT